VAAQRLLQAQHLTCGSSSSSSSCGRQIVWYCMVAARQHLVLLKTAAAQATALE
jgi:hypothetical protein